MFVIYLECLCLLVPHSLQKCVLIEVPSESLNVCLLAGYWLLCCHRILSLYCISKYLISIPNGKGFSLCKNLEGEFYAVLWPSKSICQKKWKTPNDRREIWSFDTIIGLALVELEGHINWFSSWLNWRLIQRRRSNDF